MSKLCLPPSEAIFTTHEFSRMHQISLSSASHRLTRLEKYEHITKLTKGIWYQPNHKNLSRLSPVPFLLGNEQGYISFLTALNHHEVIEQIPSRIMIATTGYPRTLKTPLGIYEFIKLAPRMMTEGYYWIQTGQPYLMATAEKALLDTFYISTRKGKRFDSLPELDASLIKLSQFKKLLASQIPYVPIRRSVEEKILKLSS